MRLLRVQPTEDVTSLESVELQHPTQRPPRYAILSHTWGDDEVLFDNVQEINPGQHIAWPNSSAIAKCWAACSLACLSGIQNIWIDTCCIDKKNSTELSEAINSMFRYYAESDVCYVYLSDVPDDDDVHHRHFKFRQSRWFQRGWTLQELLAPKDVQFYSQGWELLGSKAELKGLISSITRIPEDVLAGGDCQPPARSLAEVLSWASRRQTTVVEDGAYSLLGLMDINMPLLYGEGPKAFPRLQEELLKRYDDESLFAWESPAEDAVARPCQGLLSPSLAYFEASHRFRHPTIRTRVNNGSARHLASNGISLKFPRIDVDKVHGLYYALLDCQINGAYDGHAQPAIQVQHLSGNNYARVDVHHIHEVGFDQLMTRDGFIANCLMVFPAKPQVPRPVLGFTKKGKWALEPSRRGLQSYTTYGARVAERYPAGRWLNVGSNPSHVITEFTGNETAQPTIIKPTRIRSMGILILDVVDAVSGAVEGKAQIVVGLETVRGGYPGAIDRVKPWGFLMPVSRGSLTDVPNNLLEERPRNLAVKLVGSSGTCACYLEVGVTERDFPGRVLYQIELAGQVVARAERNSSPRRVVKEILFGTPDQGRVR